jgi:hypothetical protein
MKNTGSHSFSARQMNTSLKFPDKKNDGLFFFLELQYSINFDIENHKTHEFEQRAKHFSK